MSDVLKVLFDEKMSGLQRSNLDDIVRSLSNMERQRYFSASSDKTMPRLIWKDGISSLTELTAFQKMSILFTVIVMSFTEDGHKCFQDSLGADAVQAMVDVFQMLLCYWMWLKKKTFWKCGDTEEREQA